MKRNALTVIVGLLLLLIFALLLFVFQVRVTEVAVVSTFGKPTRPITNPGVYFKWPWPIQKVTKLDQRIHNFESKFEETSTADGRNLVIMVYSGWQIADPELFYNRFANGSIAEAERSLEGLVRSAQSSVVGQHPFGHFISTDPRELKFVQIESEMLAQINSQAKTNYGIDLKFLGIKKLGLPESITQKVFDRMKAERNKEADKLLSEGESQAIKIRSAADLERNKLLAEANAEATRIEGEGVAAAAKYFSVFEREPDLAIFLEKLTALEGMLRDGRSTLILDEKTPGFDLLRGFQMVPAGASTNRPSASSTNANPGRRLLSP